MAENVWLSRRRLLEAAQGYLALGMCDHALAELRAIGDPEGMQFEYYRLRGEVLREKKDYDSALEAFARALDEEPGDLAVLLGMAWCYKRTDQLSRAVATMQQAYQFAPQEPIVLYNLSCYFALAGNKPQAISWLGRALRLERALRELIPDESDFDRLRDDPDFQFVAEAYDYSDPPQE